MTVQNTLQRLKAMGCKLTPQRRLLVDVLVSAGDYDLTADEIFQQIRKTYPEVGLDTVYRNLRLMARLGLVSEVKLPGETVRYSLNREMHEHELICLECGREIPLVHCPIKELEAIARTAYGFDITSHRIELFGYCDKCSEARGTS